jgi:diphthamide synthase subunit DPH2
MPNRRASITEADIKRAIQAARKAGATEVVVQMPDK